MKKRAASILLFCLFAATCASARKEETIEQLAARAAHARTDQQPDLYMQAAERELKFAIQAYKASQSEALSSALREIVTYSDNAHSAAIHSGKHQKRTEIKIREISAKLADIKLNADVSDQPAIQSAIDRLEKFRTELLQNMFGSGKDD